MTAGWLTIVRGDAPLMVTIPHAGTEIPDELAADFVNLDLARKDADRFVDRLYAFVADLGATLIATRISRSVIDVNRDPSGASLYPGMTTTELCPTTTFDGEPLYRFGLEPDAVAIEDRRARWFTPYHEAIESELARLSACHAKVVHYDAHSIRSFVPRLFHGELPVFNIGANGGLTCAPQLSAAVEAICAATGQPTIVDGRFRGGWTTRHYGRPAEGVHAIQMELAMRAYADEAPWPPAWNPARAAPAQIVLREVLTACLDFAQGKP